jgi:hypothetical protein
MFLATGEAKKNNDAGCPEGDVHSLLIFSRQADGTASDEKLARRGAAWAGCRRAPQIRTSAPPTRTRWHWAAR